MIYRNLGATGLKVSEIGYGMWGLAGWTGSDQQEVLRSLELSVEKGCTFFDTAWAYADGRSEEILGELLRRHPGKGLVAASKIPPKNRKWPSKRGFRLEEVFPADYIREYVERSLKNLGMETLHLMQFHVWEDSWAQHDEWQRTCEDLTREGKVQHWGVSVNRWEPDNVLETLKTGAIAAVQVIYNIFDQNPEDRLFPLCRELGVGIIARVPFDEGTLTGTMTVDTVFPPEDWRSLYFVPENLIPSVQRADALKPLVPDGMTMPEMALRFILCNPDVSTIIPGMRKERHVAMNTAVSDGQGLPAPLLQSLKAHRWDRTPTEWSY